MPLRGRQAHCEDGWQQLDPLQHRAIAITTRHFHQAVYVIQIRIHVRRILQSLHIHRLARALSNTSTERGHWQLWSLARQRTELTQHSEFFWQDGVKEKVCLCVAVLLPLNASVLLPIYMDYYEKSHKRHRSIQSIYQGIYIAHQSTPSPREHLFSSVAILLARWM